MSNDIENKLNPCPFCGGKCDIVRGESVSDAWRHGRFWRVFCTRCQVRQLFHKTKGEAVIAWNHRERSNNNRTKLASELERYNNWRRGAEDIEQPNPTELGILNC